jgi:hypothetical protein
MKSISGDRGPDETDGARLLINSIGALAGYFTNPTTDNPEYWQQCAHCLMVSKKLVDENLFKAHLVNTDQNVTSARATILNQLVTDCCIAFLSLHDKTRDEIHDHMILRLTNENPPPFDADPRIIEYIEHMVAQHTSHLNIKAMKISQEEATKAHIEETNQLNKGLQEDLKILWHEANCQIVETCNALEWEAEEIKSTLSAKLEQEIADFKAGLNVEKELHKKTSNTTTYLPSDQAMCTNTTIQSRQHTTRHQPQDLKL